jgi:geranylgeranyl diphosphate synthase type I
MNIEDEYGSLARNIRDDVDDYMISNLEFEDEIIQDATTHLINAGGKRLRPVILLLVTEMMGRSYEDFIPVAAGLEALHTSSLLQDDHPVMDDHDIRRGVRTVHREYGEAVTILASDILRSKATTWCTMIDSPKTIIQSVVEEFDKIVLSMCIGQKNDIHFENKTNVNMREYIDMVSDKTAKIYASAAKIGATIAEAATDTISHMEDFGMNLGIAFQITDDVLDVESNKTGKDKASDLENNKKTAVTIHCRKQGYDIFSDDIPVNEKTKRIRKAGSVEYARRMSSRYTQDAIKSLKSVTATREEPHEILLDIANKTSDRMR